jgi:hypothetical protein
MTTATNNPLARDPEILSAFRERVENEDWAGARRLTLAMQLHRTTPQKLMERDDVYLRRLMRKYAPDERIARTVHRNRGGNRSTTGR